MSNARELAKQGIVGGKTLKEWADAPAGAFEKEVRKIDPYYGMGIPEGEEEEHELEPRWWKVEVHYNYVPEPERERASKTYEVEAVTAEEAKDKAAEEFNSDDKLEGGEAEIESMEEPEPQED